MAVTSHPAHAAASPYLCPCKLGLVASGLEKFLSQHGKNLRTWNTSSGTTTARCFQSSTWTCLAMPWARHDVLWYLSHLILSLQIPSQNCFLLENGCSPSEANELPCKQASLRLPCPLVAASILTLFLSCLSGDAVPYITAGQNLDLFLGLTRPL